MHFQFDQTAIRSLVDANVVERQHLAPVLVIERDLRFEQHARFSYEIAVKY